MVSTNPVIIKKVQPIAYDDFVAIYKKQSWTKVGNWPIPNMGFSIFPPAYIDSKHFEYFGLKNQKIIQLTVLGEAFDDTIGFEKLSTELEKHVESGNVKFFKNSFAKQTELRKRIETKAVAIRKIKITESKFASQLNVLIKDMILLTSTFEYEKVLSSVIEKHLAKRLSELGRSDISLPQLFAPDTRSDTAMFTAALEALAKDIIDAKIKRNSKKYELRVEEIIERFGYINAYLLASDAYDFNAIEKMVAKTESDIISNSTSKKDNNHEVHTFDDEKINKLIWLLNESSINRLLRVECINKAFYLLTPQFKEIAEKINVSLKELTELFAEELIEIVDSKYTLTKSISNFKMAGYYGHIDGTCVLSPEDCARFKKEFLDKSHNVSELKGTPSYPGVVRAKVRVIPSHHEFSSFQDGEVLVCSMTDPNYVPLMKKASAIVTDMGGILCHAAIVSRELKKPCVIGTKIATKALKTGEMVEVDAVKGIVKRLNL